MSYDKPQEIYTKSFVNTSGGKIAYAISEGKGTPIVLIHGNSSSKEAFKKQFDTLGKKYKVIAFDLPGHGKSENALNPEQVYSFPGYARVIIEALEKLNISQSIFCGWSLGGHIAIELLSQRSDLVAGLIITGTPPIPLTAEGLTKGFKVSDVSYLTGQKEQFSIQDAYKFLTHGGFIPNEVPDLVEVNMRADGNARHFMIKSVKDGIGVNAKDILERTNTPISVIIGEKDPWIKNGYIKKEINYSSLVSMHHIDCGHAPHWEQPELFNCIVDDFVQAVSIH
ncbi:alpha/beta fold hydrolase [Candidatus Paracaedibacter symbiosus]|uniref:alpha/beta fold hydrolase n=1 Tax=Candidatus Paracaedibacter symbiosus TaxID=244582 RepID=UPI000509DBF3|nr:alpha/beta hydrolase [Candidatus Paracaedibacter symbiosus]